MVMDKKALKHIKALVSSLEGAPFPNDITDELYNIWFEHSRNIVNNALEYLNIEGMLQEDSDDLPHFD
jgi:hypothetical protein